MRNLKINCHKGTYFTGLGDTVLLAWLAEGARGTDTNITLVADGQRRLMLECLGVGDLVTTDEKDSILPSDCYSLELADQCNKPRIDYVKQFFELDTVPKRPTPNIPEQFLSWAYHEKHNVSNELVLIFPETHWTPRRWPINHFVDLAWQLRANNIQNIIMLEKEKPEFANTPRRYWGYNLAQVMALMTVADVVVGNDSLPAHLAGTLNKKTIAILGPTRPNVFAHIPNVVCAQSDKLDCVGCHFKGGPNGFRAACDIGCMSLNTLTVDDIMVEIGALL